MTETMATRAHAKKSASGSKRWMNCAGSIPLADLLPPGGSSLAAREGTAAHALGEHCLRKGHRDAEAFIGGVVLSDDAVLKPAEGVTVELREGYDFPIDTDMADAVQVYLDYCWGLIDANPGSEVLIEARGKLDWIGEDMFGTNDFAIVAHFDFLEIVDYKHGKGVVVEVLNNPQVLYYLLAIAKKFSFDFDRYRVTVVQPRARHADGPIRSWDVSSDLLFAFQDALRMASGRVDEAAADAATVALQTFHEVAAFLQHKGWLSAGEWCHFCPAAGQPCPELRDEAFRTALDEFSTVEDGRTAEAPKRIDERTGDAELRRAMDALPMLDSFARAVEAETLRRLRAQADPDKLGYKLVRKRANRAWREKDEAKVAEGVAQALGVDRSLAFQEPKLKSPSQIEQLRPPGMKAAAVKKALAGLWHKPEGGVTVAPVNDPREAVDVSASAAGDFEEVREEAGNA